MVRTLFEAAPEHVKKLGTSSNVLPPDLRTLAAFSLEITHGTWIATPFIKFKPPSKKCRTFGPVVFEHTPEIQGRFTGLLPGKKNEDGTLH